MNGMTRTPIAKHLIFHYVQDDSAMSRSRIPQWVNILFLLAKWIILGELLTVDVLQQEIWEKELIRLVYTERLQADMSGSSGYNAFCDR